jgi:hypothetical protein
MFRFIKAWPIVALLVVIGLFSTPPPAHAQGLQLQLITTPPGGVRHIRCADEFFPGPCPVRRSPRQL